MLPGHATFAMKSISTAGSAIATKSITIVKSTSTAASARAAKSVATVCSVGIVVMVDDGTAVRNVVNVVVDDRVVVPIWAPMRPSPAISAEETYRKAEAKR